MDIDTDQFIPTDELCVGLPKGIGMLAIRQCLRASDHERDYMGACRAHLLEARRVARWLAGMDPETQAREFAAFLAGMDTDAPH